MQDPGAFEITSSYNTVAGATSVAGIRGSISCTSSTNLTFAAPPLRPTRSRRMHRRMERLGRPVHFHRIEISRQHISMARRRRHDRPRRSSIDQRLNDRPTSRRRNLKSRKTSHRRNLSCVQSPNHASRGPCEAHIPVLKLKRAAKFHLLDELNRSVRPAPCLRSPPASAPPPKRPQPDLQPPTSSHPAPARQTAHQSVLACFARTASATSRKSRLNPSPRK